MQGLRSLITIGLSILLVLTVPSCITSSSSAPDEVKAQALDALDMLQVTWNQDTPDTAKLRAQAAALREHLRTLCSAYLPAGETATSSTGPLVAKPAATSIAPSTVSPSRDTPSPDSIKEHNDSLDQTHLAPNPSVLQKRAILASCQHAMELLAMVDNVLSTENLEASPPIDVLAQLRQAIEQISVTPLP